MIKMYFPFRSVFLRHGMLVNSDTAVSQAHSVVLVGRCCCHMKRAYISALPSVRC